MNKSGYDVFNSLRRLLLFHERRVASCCFDPFISRWGRFLHVCPGFKLLNLQEPPKHDDGTGKSLLNARVKKYTSFYQHADSTLLLFLLFLRSFEEASGGASRSPPPASPRGQTQPWSHPDSILVHSSIHFQKIQ